MHSIHTLAHRAPPAARSRARWQPYAALASASSSSSSSTDSPSLSTPATSVSPSPKPTPLCETERLKAHSSMPQLPKESKNKYVTGLVDQAVKSLCEIWRPQDIPTVFLTSNKPTIGPEIPLPPRASHLPTSASPLLRGEPDITSGLHRNNLVPMKGFVHEVLRRSRTSGSVLQTALCYLEAIRSQVPELVAKEQSGEGTFIRYDSDSRITPATPAELALEAQLSASSDIELSATDDETVMDTVRVTFDDDVVGTATPFVSSSMDNNDKILGSESFALLPSPLLCPRRAFLASLILASKFTQDKCYSNRAWAKLSGLPAKEIGRCERALGDALDWRLWVGKTPATSPAASSSTRPLGRCQSETALPASTPANKRPLRRSSTVPTDAFACGEKEYIPVADKLWPGSQLGRKAQEDESMESPKGDSFYSTSSSSSHSGSPIPPTPGLSYSPSSTESDSSSGDRTIQMSTFLDDAMASGCGDTWGPAPTSPTLSGLAFEAALRVAPVPAFGNKLGPDAAWQWAGYNFAKFAPVPPPLAVDYSVAVS
ncbi:hypothetical protein MIND_00060500 [Mycena indigotica]|uniref:G1/S-specific cyclin n=1 Tax=Mycena indigotica TaxID=2126181 RepID=A0A8H6TDK4_9AGAR|nr:uncharacterized protein MIND_00060500 [Mycena indigotica]KAF7315456.1 hypothetical protein MIND_00060500 [Mycena indigotica]